jgi:hypothetical protein
MNRSLSKTEYHSIKGRNLMKFVSTRHILLTSAALLTLSAPAFALDGADLLKKLNAAYATQGGEILAASVDVDGKTVTMKGVTVGLAAQPDQKFPLGEVTFEGVEEDNGGYTVETTTLQNMDYTHNNLAVTASDIYVSGLTIPADATGSTLASMLFYDEVHTGPLHVSVDGKEVASLEETNTTMTLAEDDSEIGFDFNATGFKADTSNIADPQTKATLDQLKIQSISGSMTMIGTWELATGTLDVSEYAVDLNDIGRLNIAFAFSGYTLDFIKTLQETTRAQALNPNKEEANQAAGLAMLGLAQQLSFKSAEISFIDDSITKRVIDYAAAQQGKTSEELTQLIKGMVPFVIASLNVPELQNSVSTAVNAFLDKPENFTISANPEKPVPVPMILGAAMGAPNTLPGVLGVKVSAND